jgi:Kef-type K+ transport system membrane component KefB
MQLIPKDVENLWTLFTAPIVWAVHFLICYVTVAIYCSKSASLAISYDGIRLALGGVTIIALAFITLAAGLAWRQWGFGTDDPPHDQPTRHERLLFQGFATLLLSGLSFVAVIYVSIPLIFIEACHP